MDFFDEAALRLKQQLKVTEDKQAAEMLGMTGNAWTMRKRRRNFPEKELRALVQQRPDLGLDVDYVLTGSPPVAAKPAWLRLKAQLEMHEDDAVAAWLRMSMADVNAYTKRGVFPVQQFLAACGTRSELVDQSYVLTGVPQAASEMIDAARKGMPYARVAKDEEEVLSAWRKCTLADQSLILQMMERLAARGGQ